MSSLFDLSPELDAVNEARVAGKTIIAAKHELIKRAGAFLFNAEDDEEFFARLSYVDSDIEDVARRSMANVSDSKAKLAKAVYNEWKIRQSHESRRIDEHGVAHPVPHTHTDDEETSISHREANKYIRKDGDHWVITQKGTGKVLSRHPSKEKAEAAFKAMESHMHGSRRPLGSYYDGPDESGDPNPRTKPCSHCGQDAIQTIGYGTPDTEGNTWVHEDEALDKHHKPAIERSSGEWRRGPEPNPESVNDHLGYATRRLLGSDYRSSSVNEDLISHMREHHGYEAGDFGNNGSEQPVHEWHGADHDRRSDLHHDHCPMCGSGDHGIEEHHDEPRYDDPAAKHHQQHFESSHSDSEIRHLESARLPYAPHPKDVPNSEGKDLRKIVPKNRYLDRDFEGTAEQEIPLAQTLQKEVNKKEEGMEKNSDRRARRVKRLAATPTTTGVDKDLFGWDDDINDEEDERPSFEKRRRPQRDEQ